ncbi:hypothetical protein CVT24_002072 [Panaeolus cyanescens]|uniref:AB hydrolase-1 domain-containing protein n=1 Tax=Panaeolus cyanescens TaxID=181874 RepID=A0A409W1I0_9AGAR|nr:hypothetical protein CVT24_002072 [Panaeolus cyanescens]
MSTAAECITEGKVNFKVGNETYQTWYKIYGDINNGKMRPVVAVHGGPGMSHHYMLIPVVFYDQLGNGQSSHCPGVPKEFWTPELFMDELDNLLRALNIYDDFDLLGQSWGGMLGGQYAATHTPPGLKRLIIANSPASTKLNSIGYNHHLDQFPPEFAAMVRKHEADGTTASKEYQEAFHKFSVKHVCTVVPWPKELVESFDVMEKNPTVYHVMYGTAEFNVLGTMKDWDIVPILHRIVCPTLLISAPLDSIQEIACIPFFTQIQKVKWVQLQNSTHLAVFEEPERYFEAILDFLKETEPQV